jgi:hypothetical protein
MQCTHNAFKVAVEVFKEKRGERERQIDREGGGEEPCKKGSLDSTTHVVQSQLNLSFPFLPSPFTLE